MSDDSVDTKRCCIRLCHIVKWDNFDGYGFNLHAEKGKPGQYVGKVDEGSPAEAAGLKEGDRIIEVNDVNIANENHKQVVQRIKTIPNETKLLVVDNESDAYFKMKNVVIKNDLPEVVHLKTPNSKLTNGRETNSISSSLPKYGSCYEIQMDDKHASENHTMCDNNKLNLNMTAKELRAQLASRKKYDPKKDCLDFKKKYEIVQKL